MTFDATAGLGYTFDQENRLTGASGYAYTYDGARVRKADGQMLMNCCRRCLQTSHLLSTLVSFIKSSHTP